MAERVTLDLFLNDRGALTSIEDLKAGIKAANAELETVSIGSQRFQELKASVAAANSELKNIQKQTKGITSEEFTSAFARIGAGVASGFAVATSALNLFGIESENVTEAAIKAQNALSIAIGSRQVLEGILSLKLLANNVQEKARLALTKLNTAATNENTGAEAANAAATTVNTRAKKVNTSQQTKATASTVVNAEATVVNTAATNASTVATGAFSTALKALYGVIARNPMGFLLTAIGALVGSIIYFTQSTDEADEKLKEFNKTLNESQAEIASQQVQILGLIDVVNDETRSQKDREAAYKNIQKQVPGLNDLTLKQAQASGKLSEAYQLEVSVLKEKAKLDAAAALYTQSLTEIYTLQSQAVNGQIKDKEKYAEATNLLRFDEGLLIQNAEEYNDALIAQTNFLDANTRGKKGNTSATNEQILNNTRLKNSLDAFLNSLKDELELYKSLGIVSEFESKIPAIVEKTNRLLKERAKIAGETGNAFLRGLNDIGFAVASTEERIFKANMRMREFYTGTAVVVQDSVKILSDAYGNQVEKDVDNLILAIGNNIPTFSKYIETIRDKYIQLFETGEIDYLALQSINSVVENLKKLNRLIREGQTTLQEAFQPRYLNQYQQALQQVLVVEGKLVYGYNQQSKTFEKLSADREEYLKNAQYVAAFESQLVRTTIRGLEQLKKNQEELDAGRIEEAFKLNQINKAQRDTLLAYIEEGSKSSEKVTKLIEDIATQRVESIKKQVRAVLFEFDAVGNYQAEFAENQRKSQEISGKAIVALIRQEKQAFLDLSGYRLEQRRKSNKKIEELDKALAAAGIKLEKVSTDEKIKLYNDLYEYQKEVARKIREEQVTEFQNFLRIIQTAMNAYQEFLTTSQNTALERLEYNQNKQLEALDKTSQFYEQKRTELVEEYEAQRYEIQKRYRLKQLKLDQAQAVANAALGISRAYAEGGVAGLITGSIVAIAAAAQLNSLQQQINLVQSMKKGGFLKAQQGLIIQGPSHEYGGVNLQNGAYNLEGGEAVINRVSSRNYQGLLSQINQMGGGRPLVASFDDSRIVDALARQKMEPIRAYVIEQDITRAQGINKRLEQLSRF